MSEKKDLKNLERKLLTAYHQDGILDLIVGFDILLFAMVMLFDQAALIGLIAIPNVFYISLKQKITVPRLGFVQFEPEQEQKRKLNFTLLAGVAMFIGLVVFYAMSGNLPSDISTWIGENILLIFGAVIGLVLAAIGYFLNCTRFYGYAALGAVPVWVAHFGGFEPDLSILLTGIVVEALGIMILLRFLQQYPIQAEA